MAPLLRKCSDGFGICCIDDVLRFSEKCFWIQRVLFLSVVRFFLGLNEDVIKRERRGVSCRQTARLHGRKQQ